MKSNAGSNIVSGVDYGSMTRRFLRPTRRLLAQALPSIIQNIRRTRGSYAKLDRPIEPHSDQRICSNFICF
jgi:hypothetical protein